MALHIVALRVLPTTSIYALRRRWLHLSTCASPFTLLAPTGTLPVLPSGHRKWTPWQSCTRDRSGGRPWDYYVARRLVRSRPPSDRQRNLLSLWCLNDPSEPMMLCNLKHAEDIMRRHYKRARPPGLSVNEAVTTLQLTPACRDSLKLAYHPGEVCHTMTSSISNLYWLCGSRCDPGFLTPFPH